VGKKVGKKIKIVEKKIIKKVKKDCGEKNDAKKSGEKKLK